MKEYREAVFKQLTTLKQNHSNIILYSALADGADRLMVHEAMKLNIEFIAVLPMALSVYEKDFTCKSKGEFYHLLSKAKETINLGNKNKNKDTFYEKAGHFISDNCDILFALWDGEHIGLKGGTSDIVKYHLKNKKELWHLKVDRNAI